MHYIKTRMYKATYVNKNVKMVCNLAKKDNQLIKFKKYISSYYHKNIQCFICKQECDETIVFNLVVHNGMQYCETIFSQI